MITTQKRCFHNDDQEEEEKEGYQGQRSKVDINEGRKYQSQNNRT